ncbi:hypothetical protein CPB85DRAFT_1176954, partial [Mucidula mucida]
SNLCRFGCIAIEDMHHTFVCCPQFSTYRADALKDVERSLFLDNPVIWPLALTQFYLGHVPPLDGLIPRDAFSSGILRDRVLRNISSSWHITFVRLAGRIWG